MLSPFETQSRVAHTHLELSKEPELDLPNSCTSCLYFQSSGITEIYYHMFFFYNTGYRVPGFVHLRQYLYQPQ